MNCEKYILIAKNRVYLTISHLLVNLKIKDNSKSK